MANGPEMIPPALVQRFMFESGFDVPDPDLCPAIPRLRYMKLSAKTARVGADRQLKLDCNFLRDQGWPQAADALERFQQYEQ